MKTIIINKKKAVIYTIADLARTIGISGVAAWNRVRIYGTLPVPPVHLGNRDYYDEETFKAAVTAYNESKTASEEK